ncbi:MAG TPA: hypothetical protein VN025_07300 [Candidatus Dormibacteraeota bacterium]|nr:hypothetical protein [Candidatus Dormibacteraeota bacterium]
MKTFRYRWILFGALLQLAALNNQAGAQTASIHSEVQQTYNFQPHLLTTQQINEKSGLLDKFWEKAKSQRDVYIPGLRQELADFSSNPFFLFDGSQLLLSLSNTPADRKIVCAAIAHTDLHDLQSKDYFLLVHRMAAQGEDTTAAAFHILAEPKFQIFIPEHSLTLAQDFCVIYMLLPTDPDFWLKPAIERLRTESDVMAQRTLLLLLWYAQTPDADKAIQQFSADASKPLDNKGFATELLHRKDTIDAAARTTAAATNTEESLRQSRRDRLKAVSDEALEDLDTLTEQIIAKRN